VRGAVHRAAGQLRILSLNRTPGPLQLLNEALAPNGAALQQVTTDVWLSVADLAAIFAAAPRLHVLNAQVTDDCTPLLPIMRNDPPYGPLRLSQLAVHFPEQQVAAAADVRAVAAAVAAHESLKGLSLADAQLTAGQLNELMDAAAERRLSRLALVRCVLDADSAPALARLLQRGSLTDFTIMDCAAFPAAQETSMPVLCNALRACRSLTYLRLHLTPPNSATRRTVTELLDAAMVLPALSELDLLGSIVQDTAAFGLALGTLLADNPSRLRILNVFGCRLGDLGMGRLLAGLAANTHLRMLRCEGNRLSAAFKRDRMEPALAALAARAELDARQQGRRGPR
jgi:hypothetical protein